MADSTSRAESGFTLVELIGVIVIIGLAAAAVVLVLPEEGGSLAYEAERFAARAKAARDSAIVEARPVAVRIGPGGYEVARRAGGAWQTQARYDWAERTRPERALGLRFDPAGMAEPAVIVLRRGDRRAVIEIGGDGGVRVAR